MNRNYQNSMLSSYHNAQMGGIPFQRNALLKNNPNFQQIVGGASYYVDDEKGRAQNVYQQMNKLRGLQEIRRLEKYSDLEKYVDKDRLRESVIKPIKIEKADAGALANDYVVRKKDLDASLVGYWKNRTNQPYKNILINENYNRTFKAKEDLIIHRVTDADHDGLMDEFRELLGILERHDDELTVIYSTSKEAEHLSKFKQNHVYKFRIKFDPSDFNKLKKDRIKYYKNEQKKLEFDRKKTDDLIEAAIQSDIITEGEIKELDERDAYTELEEELRREFGKDYENIIKEAIGDGGSIKDKYRSRQKRT
ncbi:MAG: hypothetical protein Hyperionvirus25_19 [Hyperionvirus sp.]|uniref:Uncharacterized protein n=1 Tax=Hyperionvirus sp. TaxID=2487770 RepID=A0A3G5AEX0_9VIRU|nr:MAG: hypothetical protein Hyperionvirus25_19 [Hyperionvirus sp.]